MHEEKNSREKRGERIALALNETLVIAGFIFMMGIPGAMETGPLTSGIVPLVISGLCFGAAHVIGLIWG